MSNGSKPLVIALEEHYSYPEAIALAGGAPRPRADGGRSGLEARLSDLGEVRLAAMDEAGIDVQVISHTSAAIQQADPELAVELATRVNDRLHDAVGRHPGRFGGFAALPTPAPQAAADELERAVVKLGFKGAMIWGLTNGSFSDEERFWPIFERAQALDVPIYVHPGPPHPAVVDAYYGDYLKDFPGLTSAAWGFTIETANHALRLILSGLFDAYPRLKIILGHMGEGLPFLIDRIDESLSRPGNRSIAFKEVFCRHFYITTSGHFSTPALICSIMEMGIDRVLFSVDWPYVENVPGMKWMETVPLSAEDKEKVLNGNARRLLKM